MSNVVLGLDLGPNSIGWALVDEANQAIIDLGVRVFPEGVDNFDTSKEKSRNEDRRIARGMRRQIARRARRKRRLRDALIQAGLFPDDPAEQAKLFRAEPYALRARAVDPKEKLEPHELGRVLLHLNQRRGFLSNRKKDRGDKEVRGMLQEISDLASEMGDQTLGQFLYEKEKNFDHANRSENDHIRNRHTRRSMYEEEFEKIWDTQAKHYPELLTDRLRHGAIGKQTFPCKPRRQPDNLSMVEAVGIHGLIFFQRKMYWPKSVVGLCELEPKQKRCPRGDRHAQRFRLLQEVNNLRVIDGSRQIERQLNDDERALLLDKLSHKSEMKFDDMRKLLGQLPDSPAPEQLQFNLERGKRTKLQGMVTDHLMANKKVCGPAWHKRPEKEKDAIVRLLLDNERDDEHLLERLTAEFSLSAEQADAALDVDFPAGYVNLSLLAIDRLLPHLERGLVYQSVSDPEKSALHAAGYLRRDELQRRLFDKLPDPTRMNPRDCPLGDIPNPVVKRALVELRKVVNAIIREHGKPDAVHVETARSVRMGPKARGDYNRLTREREARRDEAATAIRKRGVKVTRDAILRYLLWQEQSGECVYCGQPVSQQQLFGGDVDVDHILPYSRCLDDSQANKVVCHRQCNHDKQNRTPHEWLAAADPQRYERLCQHAGAMMRKGMMPYGKYRKFLQKELDLDKFIARQLVDTGYITRATAEFLRCLFAHDHNVLGLKGQLTAELRRQWGLNSLLRDDDLDRKTRDDHRHHAIDALVIALTNRSCLQKLTRIRKAGYFDRQKDEEYQLPAPWPRFREDVVDRIGRINVSHRVNRKVAGGLHKDTHYGRTQEPSVFVVRKPLEKLSVSEVSMIRDARVRRAIEARLAEHHIDIGRAKNVDSKAWKRALCDPKNPPLLPPSKKQLNRGRNTKSIPIKKVRILCKEGTIRPIRDDGSNIAYVKPGSTHHLCIFEWRENGTTKRDAVFVTMLEAIERIKFQQQLLAKARQDFKNRGLNGEEMDQHVKKAKSRIARQYPIIQRVASQIDHQHRAGIPDDARFVMSLSRGEMVVANHEGEDKLLVYKTSASTSHQLWFAEHTDARKSYKKISKKPNTLNARKVTVDPLGRIRNADRLKRSDIEESGVPPVIRRLATDLVAGELSNSEARRKLEESGLKHLGAQLTAMVHHLRSGSDLES